MHLKLYSFPATTTTTGKVAKKHDLLYENLYGHMHIPKETNQHGKERKTASENELNVKQAKADCKKWTVRGKWGKSQMTNTFHFANSTPFALGL
jgi:hypothetical protein